MALHTPLSDYYGDASKTSPNDTPETRASKLFVGGLAHSTTPQMLTMYFSRFGTVEATSIKLDPSGSSRGFGFVKMGSAEMVEKILAAAPHYLDRKAIDVKPVMASIDPSCKLFVGGLTLTTTNEMLRTHFSDYGTVVDASIRRDSVGKPRGFGFILFAQPQSVDAVLKSGTLVIDGKVVEPKRLFKDTANGPMAGLMPVPKLFVGGLHLQTSQDTLAAFYSKFGLIHEAKVVVDPVTGKRRGFGFVRFADQDGLERAMGSRPHAIDGKQVQAKRALMSEKPENLISTRKIFVGGLKSEHTMDVLMAYFVQYGSGVVVTLPSRGVVEGRHHRGFAFVDFDDYDSVDRIILQRQHIINGVEVDIRKGLSKEDKLRVDQLKRERELRVAGMEAVAGAITGLGINGPWIGGASGGPSGGGQLAEAGGYRPTLTGYGGVLTAGAMGHGGYGLDGTKGDYGEFSGYGKLVVKGDAFRNLLEKADVSQSAIDALADENLMDSGVLSVLTVKEFDRLPITMGDRKRIELALRAMH
jgi:heterogeneous nuclear ribonucleoprotein A1/A3